MTTLSQSTVSETPESQKRKNKICDQRKIKSTCNECGGGSICDHGRIKSTCKECGGGSICDHGRIKSTCKEYVVCVHGIQTFTCSDCKVKSTGNNRGTKRPEHQLFEGRRHKSSWFGITIR